jgi:NAD(P)-dependent dehydrogenase (short-subunit alcohol dehydrogenase family)
MRSLEGRVAVVGGASRGAGRGIALALGEAGATVYVVGRTTRGGPRPRDGAPGTVDDTADEVTRRGGVGIPVRADCTSEPDVSALFERIEREQERLHVVACAVWGAADATASTAEALANWGKPFWELPAAEWTHMMTAGPFAYYLLAHRAAPLLAKSRGGLVVGVTDGFVEGQAADAYHGQLVWDLAHTCINRLMLAIAAEGRRHKIAALALMPGFMRTERVVRHIGDDEKLKKMFRFDASETPEYLGRAVSALAADPRVARKSGKVWFVADLASEYGFTDVDGKRIPRFKPFG